MTGEGSNLNTIILGVTGLVSVLTPIILALINRKAGKTLANSEETKVSAAATATSVEKVHVAVNSERKAMVDKMDAMHEEIRVLTKALATATEQSRAQQERGAH